MRVYLIILIISQINFTNVFSQKNDTIYITDSPINLSPINSPFDDYNSCISIRAYPIERLIFSTNRFSDGENYDLISYYIKTIPLDKKNNKSETGVVFEKDTSIDLSQINTSCNEFGPYFIKFNPLHYWNNKTDSSLFFVSKQCENNLDIYYCKFMFNNFLIGKYKQIDKLQPLSIVNSKFDEGYITASVDFKKLYYCSNRNGNFDIYELSDSFGSDINRIIYNNSSFQICNLDNVNSDYDDKCPFLYWNDCMIFTSNRPEGYGGFDLYYSIKKDNKWSEPINLGERINSKYDEYRPILYFGNYLIFSSNRPNGIGGFDLYIVEIKIKN